MPNKNMNFGADILPATNSTYDIGSSSKRFNDVQTDKLNGTTIPANPVFTDTTYSTFATGSSGLVPAPTSSDTGKYLKGDGTWGTVSGSGSSTLSLTAAAGSWSSATPPTQSISAIGVTASNTIIVGLASDATDEQINVASQACIRCTGQSEDEIMLTAFGVEPDVNIPVSVVIL